MSNTRMKKYRTVRRLVEKHITDLEQDCSLPTVSEELGMCGDTLIPSNHSTSDTTNAAIASSDISSVASYSMDAVDDYVVGDDTSTETDLYEWYNSDTDSDTHVEDHVMCAAEPPNQHYDCDDFVDPMDCNNPLNKYDIIAGDLAFWAVCYNIKQNALSELFKILGKYHKLPKDPRTLLGTKRHTVIREMKGADNCSFEYTYFGIKSESKRSLKRPIRLHAPSVLGCGEKVGSVLVASQAAIISKN